MYKFVFDMPTRVLFGAGQLQELHNEKLPGKKALLAISNGTSVKKYGYLNQLEKELDLCSEPRKLDNNWRGSLYEAVI